MVDLKAIFKEKIFIEAKVKSIDSLFLNEDRLDNTNYHPTYQRNYVWDEEKATYFIESIFLGTEIPPLIFFQKELSFEVIDGRQRYETILRFIKGELRLRKSGLHKLGTSKDFVRKEFKELEPEYQDLFLRTKIRTIVFSFRTDQFSQDEEDAVKREIFQRYNSGITPLKSVEIDKAVYLKDNLNTDFKNKLNSDSTLLKDIKDIFSFEKDSIEVIMKKIREMIVLPHIPISYYANRKLNIVYRFFEYLSQEAEEEELFEEIYSQFKEIIEAIKYIKGCFIREELDFTRLLAECLYWALSIVIFEKGKMCLDKIQNPDTIEMLISSIAPNIDVYKNVRSSFAAEFQKRYEVTAKFFADEFAVMFDKYLSTTESFKAKNKTIGSGDFNNSSFGFENLRIKKPEPVSEEIEDICRKLTMNNFLMRPSYQRDEVINRKKSSAIIESLLLGIRLPPIFVFNREDGVQEVIDGQQRLLSILGFIGQQFRDEKGNLCNSKKEGFRLDLKSGILKDLNGATFDKLDKKNQLKIKRAELWIIEIDEKYNQDFEPIDLFIRLNNKPYPIRKDTFEMWNSYIDRDIVERVKEVCKRHKSWFYLRKNDTRMENENLLMTLAYFIYQKQLNQDCFKKGKLCPDKTIDIYKAGERINCRLKSKTDITKVLENDKKEDLLHAINILDFDFIAKVEMLCKGKEPLSKQLDEMLVFVSSKRTQQNFYILWLLLTGLSFDSDQVLSMRSDIHHIISKIDVVKTVEEFVESILNFRKKYQLKEKCPLILVELGAMCNITNFPSSSNVSIDGSEANQSPQLLVAKDKNSGQVDFITSKMIDDKKKYIRLSQINAAFKMKYIASLLYVYSLHHTFLTVEKLKKYPVTYASISVQNVFAKVFDYIQECRENMDLERHFFLRMLEIMEHQMNDSEKYKEKGIDMIGQVELLPELDSDKNDICSIYKKCSVVDSPIMLLALKAVNV